MARSRTNLYMPVVLSFASAIFFIGFVNFHINNIKRFFEAPSQFETETLRDETSAVGETLYSMRNVKPLNDDGDGDAVTQWENPEALGSLSDTSGVAGFADGDESIRGGALQNGNSEDSNGDTVVYDDNEESEKNRHDGNGYGDNLVTLKELCTSIQDDHGMVVLQFLNSDYLTMTKHWICNVDCFMDVLPMTVFITTDEAAYAGLKDWQSRVSSTLNVYLLEYDSVDTLYFGSLQYRNYMLFRTGVILSLLDDGISVFLCESDSLWLSNPITYLEMYSNVDVVGTLAEGINDEEGKISGGFLFLNSTKPTRELWSSLYDAFSEALASTPKRLNDQGLFNNAIRQSSGVNVQILPRKDFASGLWYDDTNLRAETTPVVIQNNFLRDLESKIERAKTFGHWHLSKDDLHCQNGRCQNGLNSN